jgi:hypothetical protein
LPCCTIAGVHAAASSSPVALGSVKPADDYDVMNSALHFIVKSAIIIDLCCALSLENNDQRKA